VRAADVLTFVTAQRSGGPAGRPLRLVGDGGGVSARTVRRRLPSVSGLFAFCWPVEDVDANPVPRGCIRRTAPLATSVLGAAPSIQRRGAKRSPTTSRSVKHSNVLVAQQDLRSTFRLQNL
jgi:hypothetical protein